MLNTAEWVLGDDDCGSGTLWQQGICCISAGAGKARELAWLQCNNGAEGMALIAQPMASVGIHQTNKANSVKAVPQERCHFFNTAFCIVLLIISRRLGEGQGTLAIVLL